MRTIPTGKIKTFGYFGIMYEVGDIIRQLDDGDTLVEITLVESGEKAEYRLSCIEEDPEAH